MQSQSLIVVAKRQTSPHVTSFGSFGTLFGTVNSHVFVQNWT